MLKLIAILVLSTRLSVAVETNDGWKEQAFPNTPEGAVQVLDYAEKAVQPADGGVRVVVGWENDDDDTDTVLDALGKRKIRSGMVSPSDVMAARAKHGTPPGSAMAVARAELDKFGHLYQQKVK